MSERQIATPAPRLGGAAGFRVRRRELVVVALTVAVVLGVFLAVETRRTEPPAAPGLARTAATPAIPATPPSSAIEERYGIRITQIGLTANGGMLDLRYSVLDPEKAVTVAHDATTVPWLIVERNGHELRSGILRHRHSGALRRGGSYYILFRNDGNALGRGDSVTVVLGKLRLQRLTVL